MRAPVAAEQHAPSNRYAAVFIPPPHLQIAALVGSGQRPPVPPAEQHADFPAFSAWMQLMTACWQQDPVARPTFDEICAQLRGILDLLVKARAASGGVPG